ncbi:ORF68 [Ovine gammaherpesvirus 2]|uniref:Packaging protein UL32 n=1 Tax=Ovine gammaherpesvirus 2 TaxID=10398 RepID=Q2VSH2_9GAMA|nr:ORF68 [Ovine gammaherpesvirus 2]AAX58104.1 ORF68 [Ovine gammaherpesvirus 2]WOZ69514.1 ORF68 capsid transport nuclear protein [Ovine gammaherpesvirus 2]
MESSGPPPTFIPWNPELIFKHSQKLQAVLRRSFLPTDLTEALSSPHFCQLTAALEPTASCKLCQTFHSLCSQYSPPISFYGDYATICYYALHAPKTWAANFMLLANCMELVHLYFPQVRDPLAHMEGLDIYLHFFVHKCFKPMKTDKILDWSNLDMLKNEFLKSILYGSLTSAFCFKNVWPSLNKAASKPGDDCPCDDLTENQGSLTDSVNPFHKSLTYPYRQGVFLDLILILWKNSDLLTPGNQLLAQTLSAQQTYFEDPQPDTEDAGDSFPSIDTSQGPCLISPSLGLQKKNHTSSMCLLCECLASHPQASEVLATFKHLVIHSISNKVKLLDRILFLQQDPDSLSFIRDREILKAVIQNCSAQELHKHLFCDPLCALNTAITDPAVLFGPIREPELATFKATLATGSLLVHRSFKSCEILETLILMFKSLQTIKANKTTVSDIIKEVDAAIRRHHFSLLSCYHTFGLYT